MSKKSEAKKKQNYQDKPLARRCRTCANLRSEVVKKSWGGDKEMMSCLIGGFAVKPNSACDLYEQALRTVKPT